MNSKKIFSTFVLLAMIIFQVAAPTPAYAAGVVGTGTPGSCTQAALDTALTSGGAVTFNCGAEPHTITVTTTKTISSNTQIDGGGLITLSGGNLWQIFVVPSGSTFVLSNLTLANGNSGTAQGGAMSVSSGGTANISAVTFSNNTSAFNSVTAGYAGGAGAIYNAGTISITKSTFSGNTATGPAGDGGAILSKGSVSITNSTFYGNSAVNNGDGTGGAIRLDGGVGPNTITHVTFSNNANDVSWGTVDITNTSATLSLSILANTVSGFDCTKRSGGTLTSTNNLIENDDAAAATCSPASILDPALGALQNNGGTTQTMAITTASPAWNFTATCLLLIDQRGMSRPLPAGGNCDLGAFELEYDWTAPDTSITANPPNPSADNTPTFSFTGNDGAGSGIAGFECRMDVGAFSACTSGSTFGPLFNGSHTFEVRAIDNEANTDPTPASYIWITANGADTVGVFRPSNGLLYLKNSNTTGFADIAINYGLGGDYPVVGDWDGDGDATIGIYRNGSFYLRNSNTIGFADLVFAFGSPGDQPIAGDWDRDGDDTIGVYRSSIGTFFLRNSNSSGSPEMIFSLGIPGDVGIAGDWNGDGFDSTGVFRPSNGALYLKNTNATGIADIQINYGLPGDKPVTGDWNNDGTDTIGVLRGNIFYLRNSNTVGFADLSFALGISGDMPIAGNWDGIP